MQTEIAQMKTTRNDKEYKKAVLDMYYATPTKGLIKREKIKGLYQMIPIDHLDSILTHGILPAKELRAKGLGYTENQVNPELSDQLAISPYTDEKYSLSDCAEFAATHLNINGGYLPEGVHSTYFCVLYIEQLFLTEHEEKIIITRQKSPSSNLELMKLDEWEYGFDKIVPPAPQLSTQSISERLNAVYEEFALRELSRPNALVIGGVPSKYIAKICAYDQEGLAHVQSITARHPELKIEVTENRSWFLNSKKIGPYPQPLKSREAIEPLEDSAKPTAPTETNEDSPSIGMRK